MSTETPFCFSVSHEIPFRRLGQRVVSFLRSQVEHEKWRGERYSEKARSIVSEGLGDAERMKAVGVSREEMFRRLFAVVDEIEPQN